MLWPIECGGSDTVISLPETSCISACFPMLHPSLRGKYLLYLSDPREESEPCGAELLKSPNQAQTRHEPQPTKNPCVSQPRSAKSQACFKPLSFGVIYYAAIADRCRFLFLGFPFSVRDSNTGFLLSPPTCSSQLYMLCVIIPILKAQTLTPVLSFSVCVTLAGLST